MWGRIAAWLASYHLGTRAGKTCSPQSLPATTATASRSVRVLGCSLANQTIEVSFNVGYNSNKPNANTQLGFGRVQFQVYEQVISAAELQRREELQGEQDRQSERENRQSRDHYRAKECLSCQGYLAQCPGAAPENCSPFAQCMFRKGMRASDCY